MQSERSTPELHPHDPNHVPAIYVYVFPILLDNV